MVNITYYLPKPSTISLPPNADANLTPRSLGYLTKTLPPVGPVARASACSAADITAGPAGKLSSGSEELGLGYGMQLLIGGRDGYGRAECPFMAPGYGRAECSFMAPVLVAAS